MGPLVFAVRDGKKIAPPRLPPAFFVEAFATDASGRGWAVGSDTCAWGAFLATVDAPAWRLERVPSSDACHERSSIDGAPFTRASAFPAAGGGLHVLLANRDDPASDPTTPACAAHALPRVVSRSSAGAWSAPRELPREFVGGRAAYVDPAGTAWIVADGKVLRAAEHGAVERVPLHDSCAQLHDESGKASASIDWIEVPFADQPWIHVHSASKKALCMAPFDRE